MQTTEVCAKPSESLSEGSGRNQQRFPEKLSPGKGWSEAIAEPGAE